jgi:hypothetical protein
MICTFLHIVLFPSPAKIDEPCDRVFDESAEPRSVCAAVEWLEHVLNLPIAIRVQD